MGWNRSGPPSRILNGDKIETPPQAIASTLNNAYIQKNKKIIENIPPTQTDPMTHYRKAIGHSHQRMFFKPITMSDLRKVMTKMKPTASTGTDNISYRTIRDSRRILEPLILHLTNQTITTKTYPKNLKKQKIAPILKPSKDEIIPESWRPVNLLPAIGKIIDRVLMQQILDYMQKFKLIPPQHHGSIKGKSTITAASEIYDHLLEILESGNDATFTALDQSAAYDVVSHFILKLKLETLGLSR